MPDSLTIVGAVSWFVAGLLFGFGWMIAAKIMGK